MSNPNIRMEVTSMPPSSAISWNSGCNGSRQAPDIIINTWWSSAPSHPAPTTRVRATKATARTTRTISRRVRGTGGSLPATLTLTTAAEDRAAAGEANQRQRRAACEAGLTGAAVNEQLLLLPSELTPGVAISVDRAATVLDRDQ